MLFLTQSLASLMEATGNREAIDKKRTNTQFRPAYQLHFRYHEWYREYSFWFHIVSMNTPVVAVDRKPLL
jgi:hypothetical protein